MGTRRGFLVSGVLGDSWDCFVVVAVDKFTPTVLEPKYTMLTHTHRIKVPA